MNKPAVIGLLLLIVAAPSLALANAGTPLMWVTMGHLVFGNLCIAAVEVAALRLLSGKVSKGAFGWLLLANYVTAALGAVVLAFTGPPLGPVLDGTLPQSFVVPLIVISWVLAFVVTVLAEWPLVRLSLPKENRAWRPAFRWCLILHVVSYGLLALLYTRVSDHSMMTDATIHRDARDFAREPIGTVYYIQGDELRAVGTDGARDRPVQMLPGASVSGNARWVSLRAAIEKPGSDNVELWVTSRAAGSPAYTQLLPAFRGRVASGQRDERDMDKARSFLRPPGQYDQLRFRYPGDDAPEPQISWYGLDWHSEAPQGFQWRLHFEGRQFFRLESPGRSTWARDLAILPSGQAICATSGRIFLLDSVEMRVATIARGRSPVVVYEPSVIDAMEDPDVTWFGNEDDPSTDLLWREDR